MAIQPLRANAVKTARAKSARASPQASSPRPRPSPPDPLGANLTCLGAPPPKTLITPALFSHPPPRPPGEEGEQPRTIPPLLGFRLPSLPAGGGEDGREGLGE